MARVVVERSSPASVEALRVILLDTARWPSLFAGVTAVEGVRKGGVGQLLRLELDWVRRYKLLLTVKPTPTGLTFSLAEGGVHAFEGEFVLIPDEVGGARVRLSLSLELTHAMPGAFWTSLAQDWVPAWVDGLIAAAPAPDQAAAP
jgi:hypothetical protein